MKASKILQFIVMFEFVSLRRIYDTEQDEECPSFCSCDPIDHIVVCTNANMTEIPRKIDRNVSLLILSSNDFTGIPNAIVNLPRLQHLDLSHNPLIKLVEVYFESQSLKELELKSCSINYVDNSIFRGFPNLETLDLSENPITFLNNSLKSISLKSLIFSRCKLKHIKPDVFSEIPNLRYLAVNGNLNLRQFHCEINSLLTLDISNCNLEHVPSGSLKEVVDLDLHGNNIQHLRNRSFVTIKSVENLNISFNTIKQIDVNSFSRLDQLTMLDLSYNRLADMEKNTFVKNERLKSLYMSHNYLTRVNNIASKSLQLLDLGFCEINSLTQFSLSNVPALTELLLTRNQISHIPDNFVAPHLVYLDLSFNGISSINNKTFSSLKYLRFLVLSGNKLTTVDPTHFSQVIDLSIEDNPWLCDCDVLHQTYNWMIKTDQNIKKLRCQLPTKVEGLTWEEACYDTWSKVVIPSRNVWVYSLPFVLTISVLIFLIYVSKILDKRRKNQEEQEAGERLAAERLEFIRRQETRERLRRLEEQEESRNAPDPRESLGPPTYNEALMLPRLDASHPSLASLGGSQPSLASLHSSNPDVSKKRKQRRKRRRRKSSSQQDVASNSNRTDGSENERTMTATELEESSF